MILKLGTSIMVHDLVSLVPLYPKKLVVPQMGSLGALVDKGVLALWDAMYRAITHLVDRVVVVYLNE